MMTMDEVYQKIVSSDKMKKRYAGIKDYDTLSSFLKELGCQETPDKFLEYVKEKCEGEISDAEVETIAGGINASDVFERVPQVIVRPVIDQKRYL